MHLNKIQLLSSILEFQVVIYNRQDCCSDRLNNVQVTVGDSSDGKGNAVCGKYGTASGKRVLEITCSKPLHGRYVTVSTPTPMMTLCEVEVMGDSRAMSLPSGPGKFTFRDQGTLFI